MKKCASCTKDLPDTALHCVFCGAKQAAAAAPAPAANKTVMGFSAADLLKDMEKRKAAVGAAPPPVAPMPVAPAPAPIAPPPMAPMQHSPMAMPPSPSPVAPPRPHTPSPAPAPMAPMQHSPMAPPAAVKTVFAAQAPAMAPPPAAPPPPAMAPPPAAPPQTQAKTMFMDGPSPMAPAPVPAHVPAIAPEMATLNSNRGPIVPQPPAPMPMPMQHSPMAPPAQRASTTAQVHAQHPPYLASQTAARNARPIDPFRGSLQLVMILFGVALIVAFNTPTWITPKLHFLYEDISKADAKLKIILLLIPSAGLLGLVLGLIPLPTIGRGAAAAVLGLFGVLYPVLVLPHDFDWRHLVMSVGMIALPAGLLLRGAYTGAMLGRILATVGIACVLTFYLVPDHGHLPLVSLFKLAIHAKQGTVLVAAVVGLLPFALALLSLLAWLPGPSSGGAPVFAWFWITLPLVTHFATVIAKGHIADVVKRSPAEAFIGRLDQQQGILVAAFLAFAGYGLAALLGKNLEHR